MTVDDGTDYAVEALHGRQDDGWPEPYDDEYWLEDAAVFSMRADALVGALLVSLLCWLVLALLIIQALRFVRG